MARGLAGLADVITQWMNGEFPQAPATPKISTKNVIQEPSKPPAPIIQDKHSQEFINGPLGTQPSKTIPQDSQRQMISSTDKEFRNWCVKNFNQKESENDALKIQLSEVQKELRQQGHDLSQEKKKGYCVANHLNILDARTTNVELGFLKTIEDPQCQLTSRTKELVKDSIEWGLRAGKYPWAETYKLLKDEDKARVSHPYQQRVTEKYFQRPRKQKPSRRGRGASGKN
jgi:hypothetical protein